MTDADAVEFESVEQLFERRVLARGDGKPNGETRNHRMISPQISAVVVFPHYFNCLHLRSFGIIFADAFQATVKLAYK